jgi:three-Cys-motif partner protein
VDFPGAFPDQCSRISSATGRGSSPAAKHEILTRYLDAWFPILASWNTKVFFIDGFAGPGTYQGGEHDSPLLAMEAAQRRQSMLKHSTVMLLFN